MVSIEQARGINTNAKRGWGGGKETKKNPVYFIHHNAAKIQDTEL